MYIYIYICKYLISIDVDLCWFMICCLPRSPNGWNCRRSTEAMGKFQAKFNEDPDGALWDGEPMDPDPCDSWDGLKGQRCTEHLGGTLGEKVKNRKNWFVNTENGAQICGYRDLPGVSPDMHRATHEFPCLCHHTLLLCRAPYGPGPRRHCPPEKPGIKRSLGLVPGGSRGELRFRSLNLC